jgi:hypothetical protein
VAASAGIWPLLGRHLAGICRHLDDSEAGTMATREDAELLLRLYELRREPRMRQARAWLINTFKASSLEEYLSLHPPGSEGGFFYRMVTTYWEMAASFVTRGLLDRELFFENCRELLAVWEKVRDLVPEARATYRDVTILRNLEQVAGAYIKWLEETSPGAYSLFSDRIRGGPVPPPPPKKGFRPE